jgi:hypothetical protein
LKKHLEFFMSILSLVFNGMMGSECSAYPPICRGFFRSGPSFRHRDTDFNSLAVGNVIFTGMMPVVFADRHRNKTFLSCFWSGDLGADTEKNDFTKIVPGNVELIGQNVGQPKTLKVHDFFFRQPVSPTSGAPIERRGALWLHINACRVALKFVHIGTSPTQNTLVRYPGYPRTGLTGESYRTCHGSNATLWIRKHRRFRCRPKKLSAG